MKPGERFDKYRIEKVLGEGGMATVYLATHDVLRSKHALKVLRIDAPDIKRRLLDEGRVQASINHPNVVAVTDIIDAPNGVALVMEYINGRSLDDRLNEEGALPPNEAIELFRGIALGVAAAHRAGVVHRDLKPANILLHQSNAGVIPKVTDFGLVKILATSGTKSGILMGTPEYMSPEQVRDSANVDQRADLWSLGAVLYEMLTGHIAFDNEDVVQVYTAVVNADYPKLDTVLPSLAPRVLTAVDKLLTVDPDERFPSAEALLRHLYPDEPLIAHEPTQPFTGRREDDDLPDMETRPLAPRRDEREPPSKVITAPPAPIRTTRVAQPRSRWTLLAAASLSFFTVLCSTATLGLTFGNRPPATRSLRIRLPDMPPDVPVRLFTGDQSVDGHGDGLLGPFPLGEPIDVWWVMGSDCDGCPDACPTWCMANATPLTPVAGSGPMEVELSLPVPDPRTVVINSPLVEAATLDGVPMTVADGMARGVARPGRHRVVLQRGECADAPAGCSASGDCPAGCASVAQTLEVPISIGDFSVAIALPASAPLPAPQPTPAPAPAPAAPVGPPPLITSKQFAAFVLRSPEWAPEAARAAGRADADYLRDVDPAAPPPGPAKRTTWAAAAAFCAGRGGLLSLDAEPVTWSETGVFQEWRDDGGALSWRRNDGVTSNKARATEANAFTGFRCRR